MTFYHPVDNPLSDDEVVGLLDKHGPGFASQHTFEAVQAATSLIRQHAFALETLGMTRAAQDLFNAVAHLSPIPRLVSAAYGKTLDEQLKMQRTSLASMIAIGLSRSEDPAVVAAAKEIAENVAKNGALPTYEPRSAE